MAIDAGFAPAKINLTLHVTGRRADGYHLLDSLVVFAEVGDRVTAQPATGLSLDVTGPEAGDLSHESDNLVLRAARFLGAEHTRLTLFKSLPVASGIGGGSADAAAALRVLSRLTGRALPGAEVLVGLGADVPVCLSPRPTRMRGIGEDLVPAGPLAPLHLVLVNPRVAIATPDVFRNLASADNAPMPARLPQLSVPGDLLGFLSACRNDLQPAAEALVPAIGQVCALLSARPGCRLSRMSGSGATCFGIFDSPALADAAASAIAARHPAWWVRSAPVLPGVS